uniref:Uncharacterized protein n=1 Tax=Timema monikensis TaxID=170555 RepID=A0A7R9E5Z8_9NEOP|nr:unnamed protein product [Timema monikensis]
MRSTIWTTPRTTKSEDVPFIGLCTGSTTALYIRIISDIPTGWTTGRSTEHLRLVAVNSETPKASWGGLQSRLKSSDSQYFSTHGTLNKPVLSLTSMDMRTSYPMAPRWRERYAITRFCILLEINQMGLSDIVRRLSPVIRMCFIDNRRQI